MCTQIPHLTHDPYEDSTALQVTASVCVCACVCFSVCVCVSLCVCVCVFLYVFPVKEYVCARFSLSRLCVCVFLCVFVSVFSERVSCACKIPPISPSNVFALMQPTQLAGCELLRHFTLFE